MDFEDLDEAEAAEGPTPWERRAELRTAARGPTQPCTKPNSRNYAPSRKMKMLFLYGGGVNEKVAKMQIAGIFKDSNVYKNMEFTVLDGPYQTTLDWHPEDARAPMKPFGDIIYMYFDRDPYANSQLENFEGIEKSMQILKEHLALHGPYDGVCGFDMGGEVLLQAAALAQQGTDPGWTGKFRFMVMFTSGTPKHLSKYPRPATTLQIPTVYSFSIGDENHPFPWYEESALFFAPECREVILHNYGHMPPKFPKGSSEQERLSRFLDAMFRGEEWTPSDHPDNQPYRNIWLPLQRTPNTSGGNGRKRLFVLVNPAETESRWALEETLQTFEEAAQAGTLPKPSDTVPCKNQGMHDLLDDARMNLAVACMGVDSFVNASTGNISVELVPYGERQDTFDLHCAEDVVSRMWQRHQLILNNRSEKLAVSWADELMRSCSIEKGESVGLVGLGTGAFIALAIGKMLVKDRKIVPSGLWLVDPPCALPADSTLEPGALVDCPVKVLFHSTSLMGPPWRWEVSTFGPFSVDTFTKPSEAPAKVLDDFEKM
eukprot:TRINITY_DN59440_c0_g1_i1.p1 TRINITY_DN59440_c0_g1~~TRINITY_DN59440_c0_g1_i1.p1  ORF type:complete len:558 (-),score=78.79 TRINITY_DN59440_c0_g1_i1:6-1637(-)